MELLKFKYTNLETTKTTKELHTSYFKYYLTS